MDKQRQRQQRTARTATATTRRGGSGQVGAESPEASESRPSRSPFKAKLQDLGVKRGVLASARLAYEHALKRFKSTSPMADEFGRITDELQVATEAYVKAGESMARCCENA